MTKYRISNRAGKLELTGLRCRVNSRIRFLIPPGQVILGRVGPGDLLAAMHNCCTRAAKVSTSTQVKNE